MRQSELDDYQFSGDSPWQDESTLRELYVDRRMSMGEIGDLLGCTRQCIHNYLKEYNIPRRSREESHRHQTPEPLRTEESLRELYVEQGHSTIEIASMVGCEPSTVTRWLGKHGIEYRHENSRKKTVCEQCGDETTTPAWKWDRADLHFCDRDCYTDWQDDGNIRGKDTPAWNGGYGSYITVRDALGDPPWHALREEIRDRDNNECQMCGAVSDGDDRNHDVHHIVPIMSGGCNAPELLTTLCRPCHHKAEAYTTSIPEVSPVLAE